MKHLLSLSIAVLAIAACSGKENPEGGNTDGGKLTVSISCNPTSAYEGVDVQWTSEVSGGKAPYTYAWDFGGDDLTSTEACPKMQFLSTGVKLVKLVVTDAAGTTMPKSKTFKVETAPVDDKGDIKLEWVKAIGSVAKVRGSSPAVSDDGTAYIVFTISGNQQIYSFKDGNLVKQSQISTDTGNGCGTPSIDSEGNVYAYAGSGGSGNFKKFNAGLAPQWDAAFWNKAGGAGKPKMWYGYPVIVGDKVLVANAGTTGTAGAVSMTDGSRISYMTSPDGGGPSGGCRQTPVVAKDGSVWQICAANGVAFTTLSALTGNGGVTYEWMVNKAGDDEETLVSSTDSPEGAAVTVGGKTYLARNFTPEGLNTRIILLGTTPDEFKKFEINESNTSAANAIAQDQGGVILGSQNEVIVNLKAAEGLVNGGIVAVNPETMELAWEFRLGEDVTGAPALTKEGNIVFGTDKGNFFIIKPNYATKKATLVAKASVNTLTRESLNGSEEFNLKMWSSVTVGDDGKMYIGFTKEDVVGDAGILCLSSASVTGPGTSAWPMYGVDRRHSGIQK